MRENNFMKMILWFKWFQSKIHLKFENVTGAFETALDESLLLNGLYPQSDPEHTKPTQVQKEARTETESTHHHAQSC